MTLNVLKEIALHLVDIHSQHQTLQLNSDEFQLTIVDEYAQVGDLLTKYQKEYQIYRKLEKELADLIVLESKSGEDRDYLQFSV